MFRSRMRRLPSQLLASQPAIPTVTVVVGFGLVRRQGGTITVCPGPGAQFRVLLPGAGVAVAPPAGEGAA